MRITIGAANIRDVSYILSNLSPADAEEIWCQAAPEMGPAELAAGCVMFGHSFVAYLDGVPAMAFGTTPMTAAGNVLSGWAFGTKRSRVCMRAVMRFCRRSLMPDWLRAGVTRIEARSIATHTVAHRWLEATGAVKEADIPEYGRNGEGFVLYVWRRSPEMHRRLKTYCR